MKKKLGVICQSKHHLEKLNILRKHLSFQLDHCVIKNNKLYLKKAGQLSVINKEIPNYDAFIFFSLHASKTNLIPYKAIKASKKAIIAFQESHQLTMHQGDINNLILSADLKIAASPLEREKMLSVSSSKAQRIISFGWLFNPIRADSTEKELGQHRSMLSDAILIILSAPTSITASSFESEDVRKNLIESIAKQHPNHQLIIKAHPLEDKLLLKKIIKKLDVENNRINILTNEDDFKHTISLSKKIFISNRTQSFIDLIDTKKTVLYLLGSPNFITEHAVEFEDIRNIFGVNFINFKDNKCIESFKEKYINQDEMVFKEIEREINSIQASQKLTKNVEEIALWEFIFHYLNKKELNEKISFDNKEFILRILYKPQTIKMHDFQFLNPDLSKKIAYFLIYAREIMNTQELKEKLYEEIFQKFLTRWFIQYYPLDALNIYYFSKNQNPNIVLSEEVLHMIKNTEKTLTNKSYIFQLFLFLNHHVTNMSNELLRKKNFGMLQIVWNFSKRF